MCVDKCFMDKYGFSTDRFKLIPSRPIDTSSESLLGLVQVLKILRATCRIHWPLIYCRLISYPDFL